MITKLPPKGSDPGRLLGYLLGGDRRGSRVIETNIPGSTRQEWARQIEDLAKRHRPRQERFVKHIILSFARGEDPGDSELRSLLHYYLEAMGYGRAPYVAVYHTDTPHHHIHIVTTPTSWEGGRVSESWDWPRSERAARAIEERWGLRVVPSSKTAALHARRSEEVHVASRLGEASQRRLFQVQVSEAATRAKTLPEFARLVEEMGYEVRLALDRQGMLRGVSFAREGVCFRGSQLGRDFSGGHLLTAFGIHYDPARHLEALRPWLRTGTGEGNAMRKEAADGMAARVEALPRAEGQEAAVHGQGPPGPALKDPPPPGQGPPAAVSQDPGARGVSEQLARLPPGRYQVAGVDAAAVAPGAGPMAKEQVAWVRTGWTEEHLAKAAPWLAQQNRSLALLLRPEGQEVSVLGFRGLRAEQVEALRRDGVEPAWVLRAGERFDVLLRAHERLIPEEVRGLRVLLVEQYGLPQTGGRFHDAVRLPGSLASPAPEADRVALIEVRHGAFSASPRLAAEVREASERGPIEKAARALALPAEVDSKPTAAAAEALAEVPALPAGSRLAALQAEVEAARRAAGPPLASLAEVDDRTLLAQAREANEQAIARAAGGAPQEGADARPQLLALEGEIARRRAGFEGELAQAEARLGEAVARVDRLAAEVQARPDIEGIERYHEATRAYARAALEHREAEQRYLSATLAQVTLDRQRSAAALVEESGDGSARGHHERLLTREVALARQAGQDIEPSIDPRSGTEALRRHLAEATAQSDALRASLRERGLAGLGAFEAAERRRIVAGQLVELAELREAAARGEASLEARLSQRDPRRALEAFLEHQRQLTERGIAESRLVAAGTDAADRLRRAAQRVAGGDLSTEALRRVNGEIVASADARHLTVPAFQAAGRPEELLGRYRDLSRQVRADAARLAARADRPSSAELGRLLQRSSELIHVHQQIEAAHRRLLRLAHPGRAPQGISQRAWDVAWLQRAAAKGLLEPAAGAHLGNAVRAPFVAAGLAAPGRTAFLVLMAARFGARLAWSWARRVLAQ